MCLREDGTVRQVGKPAISQYAKMNGLRYVINASTSVQTAPEVLFSLKTTIFETLKCFGKNT
jgi:hypothetical protein